MQFSIFALLLRLPLIFMFFMMSKVFRSKVLSLEEAWKQWASRSFHLGNLTIRDIVPVLFWCHGEAFDFNTVDDKAYGPTQLAFQWKLQSFDIQHKTKYVVSTLLNKPPKVNDPYIDNVLLQSFEETATLWWFWMHLNKQVFQERQMTTFSEKIINHESIVSAMLNTLIARSSDKEIAEMFSRYIVAWSTVFTMVWVSGDRVSYRSDQWDLMSIHKQDIVSWCMHLFTHWNELTTCKKWDFNTLLEHCSWPMFCVELTSVLIFIIDMMNKWGWTVSHIWWQAMYGYTQSKWFNEKFKQYLTVIDDDHNLSNGIQMQWMEILPAHFFRFLTFSSEINGILKEWASMFDAIENIKKKKTELIKWWYSIHSENVQSLILQEKEIKQSQELILGSIKNYEAIRTMPHKTLREGVLNQLYESQLDYLWNVQQWFNPMEERKFLAERPIEQVEWLIQKIV